MPSRLTRELLVEVAAAAMNKERTVFLCQSIEQADRLADRFRKALIDEAIEGGMGDVAARTKLFRPPGSNPSFVQLTNGGWVFFYPANDLTADEDIGGPEHVYWPSEGGNYEKVTYNFWRNERRKGCIYRPVTTAEAKAPPKKKGPRTAWDRLLEDD
jgi:hypothetical protein